MTIELYVTIALGGWALLLASNEFKQPGIAALVAAMWPITSVFALMMACDSAVTRYSLRLSERG